MSSPRLRRLLATTATATALILLTACGGDPTPTANPTDAGTAEIGDPSATPTVDATDTATTSAPPPSNNPPPPPNPYPSNAKDYGLAFLAAVKANDQTRIVDLGSVDMYSQAITNYSGQNHNGQWTHSNCSGGFCHYYNVPGNFASVGIDSGKLGKAHAVTYISFDVGTFPNDASTYVGTFINYWQNDSVVGKNAYATDGVISFMNNRTKPSATLVTNPQDCGSGKVCVMSGTEIVAGSPYGQITCYTVQTNRLGKADAIVGAKDGNC
jgi:hypothetical protein